MFPLRFLKNTKPEIEEKKSWRIQPGEYLPWKGFMFKITEVTEKGFTAEIYGVTKKLRHLAPKDAEQKKAEVHHA